MTQIYVLFSTVQYKVLFKMKIFFQNRLKTNRSKFFLD